MPRCSGGGRSATQLPTAARGPNLFATASSGALWVVEVGLFNTTTTAVAAALGLATAAGTPAGTVTEVCEDDASHTILGVVSTHHTADATVVNTRHISLGAAIGSGIIFTFGGKGLHIPEGTANGLVITCPTGTAQHLDFYFVWDE